MRKLEIFRAGSHTSSSGEALTFSEADLRSSAAVYDPTLHEAPIVIGHPKHDDPAYGWVGAVEVRDGRYFAEPKQVDPEFEESVKAGRYKKISASFYAPNSPNNPVPGHYYLRHVGFLGAMPPAVKGMASVNFADEDESDVVCLSEVDFVDWDDMTVADLFSNLRDWLVESQGIELANRVLPISAIDQLKVSAAKDDEMEMDSPMYSEPKSAKLTAKELALKEREQALAKREYDLQVAEFNEYIDRLIRVDGKALPKERPRILATLLKASQDSQTIEFSDGLFDQRTESMVDAYKASLEARPRMVDLVPIGDGVDPVDFSDGEVIGTKAKEYIESQKAKGVEVDAIAAVNFVLGRK